MGTRGGPFYPLWGLCFLWWVFMVVVETSSSKLMMQYKPNQCHDANMTTTITTRPQIMALPSADSPSMNVTSASDLICAIKAKQIRALAYIYADGTCALLGVGEAEESNIVIYAPGEIPYILVTEDVAKGKTTYASLFFNPSYVSKMAVDSDKGTIYINAEGIQQPWWLVDLGETRTVYQVNIFPRQELISAHRMHDTEIRIGTTLKTDGNFSSYSLMSYYTGPYTLDQGTLSFCYENAFIGRYLVIQHMVYNPDDYLQLTEVWVFAAKN